MTEKKIPIPGYIHGAMKNLYNLKLNQFKPFYDDLNAADCIILIGEGRSQSALYIGMGRLDKWVRTIVDVDFPGRDLLDAAPVLEKKHDRIALLVNSGSGETSTPKIMVKQLSDYIERTESSQFTIDAVVSNKKSSIGMIGEKEYGNVVELRKRDRNPKSTNGYLKHGIMNDVYELGSLLLFQKTKEALNEKKNHTMIFEEIKKESKIITKIVRSFINQKSYENLINDLETRSRITMGGQGPARNVAKMTAIRLQHVKRAIGDEAYLSGPFAPRPRAGDILFMISYSGETEPLLGWCKYQKESGGYAYSIVGNESPYRENPIAL